MPSPNYRNAKRQKELQRKTKQQEKQMRRVNRAATVANPEAADAAQPDTAMADGKRDEILSRQS